jgi:hypothetical protein
MRKAFRGTTMRFHRTELAQAIAAGTQPLRAGLAIAQAELADPSAAHDDADPARPFRVPVESVTRHATAAGGRVPDPAQAALGSLRAMLRDALTGLRPLAAGTGRDVEAGSASSAQPVRAALASVGAPAGKSLDRPFDAQEPRAIPGPLAQHIEILARQSPWGMDPTRTDPLGPIRVDKLIARNATRAVPSLVPALAEPRRRPDVVFDAVPQPAPSHGGLEDYHKRLQEGIFAPDRASQETARNTAALVEQIRELLTAFKRRGLATGAATAVGPE